jgi:divalent metal cation (Fe/Co/Zn/Cd) transporter
MQTLLAGFVLDKKKLYTWAYALALITIFYNIAEGLVSVFFGLEDESMALFGFGLDSFVEVISGVGIWHMIRRIRQNEGENPDRFERRALKITGTGFYLLTAGLAITAAVDLYRGHKPETTFWGIVIALVSILSMWLLIRYKVKVGRQLNSPAILADAACTRACLQLSIVLLAASTGYELTGFGGLDSIGALVIGGLCFREGREAFQKAAAGSFACTCNGACKADGEKSVTARRKA